MKGLQMYAEYPGLKAVVIGLVLVLLLWWDYICPIYYFYLMYRQV